jgi:hypothetical protein
LLKASNNKPGALSARTIKAICAVLHRNPTWRDREVALLEAFDSIDLTAIQNASASDAAVKKIGRVHAMIDRIHTELNWTGSRGGTSSTLSSCQDSAGARAG